MHADAMALLWVGNLQRHYYDQARDVSLVSYIWYHQAASQNYDKLKNESYMNSNVQCHGNCFSWFVTQIKLDVICDLFLWQPSDHGSMSCQTVKMRYCHAVKLAYMCITCFRMFIHQVLLVTHLPVLIVYGTVELPESILRYHHWSPVALIWV